MKKSKKVEIEKSDGIDHGKLKEWIQEAEDATTDSRALSEKCRDYYDSKQWTDAEVRKLKEQSQAATVDNRIKPKMDNLMGMEASNQTTARAFPRTPKHEQAADAATESIRFVLDDNVYRRTRSQTFEYILIEGSGGMEIFVKPKDLERIYIKPIAWDRMIYDPHSRRKDFSDARFLGQVVWMDYDEAITTYPGSEDVLDSMLHGSDTYEDKPRWMDSKRNRVKIVELYYSDKGDMWYSCFTGGGYIKEPQVSPYKNEEGETEWPYEFASAFVNRDGGRYGAAMQFLDIQDEINKRKSKALHLMSVRQTFGTEGAVEDVNVARSELAKPDGHLKVGFGEFGKDFGILPTGDMAQAQFKLLEISLMSIDAVGQSAALSGKGNTGASGRALLAREQAGKTELAPIFDTLRNLDYRVYKKVWNRVKQYWKAEKWIRVTDDENNLKWVGLNKPITKGEMLLQEAQKQGAPPEALQQIQMQIQQDPMMMEMVNTQNDIVQLDVDIVLDEVPDQTTSQIEDFQTLGEMVKSGFQMPPQAVIEASPLHHKDKILKMMKEQPQLPPQIQEQMKKMQEEGQKLQQENQSLKADQQVEAAKLQQKAQVDQQSMQLKQQQTVQELELKKAIAIAEGEDTKLKLQLAREEATAKLQLAREESQAKLQLAREEASAKLKIDHETKTEQNRQSQQQLEFDIQQGKKESDAKIKEQAKKDEAPLLESALPKVMQTMEKLIQTFAETQKTQTKALEALVKEMGKPKTITAKSSSGATLTATTH